MPRYAPRTALQTRFSVSEHPDWADFAVTGIDQVAVHLEVFEPECLRLDPSHLSAPLETPPKPRRGGVPGPSPRPFPGRAARWAPWILLSAALLGAAAGVMLSLFG